MAVSRQQIVEEARKWVNTPFGHQGRDFGRTIDCVGLVYMVGKSLNIIDHDMTTEKAKPYQGYTPHPKDNKIRQACEDYLVRIPRRELSAGDIVLVAFNTVPSHVAIFTGSTLIHALSKINKCTEHSINESWKRRFCGFYRYPKIA